MFYSLDLHTHVLINRSYHFILDLSQVELEFCLRKPRLIIKLEAFTTYLCAC